MRGYMDEKDKVLFRTIFAVMLFAGRDDRTSRTMDIVYSEADEFVGRLAADFEAANNESQ
jgi:hypothetical protein